MSLIGKLTPLKTRLVSRFNSESFFLTPSAIFIPPVLNGPLMPAYVLRSDPSESVETQLDVHVSSFFVLTEENPRNASTDRHYSDVLHHVRNRNGVCYRRKGCDQKTRGHNPHDPSGSIHPADLMSHF